MQQKTSTPKGGARTRAKASSPATQTNGAKSAAHVTTSEPHIELLQYREEFPILQRKIYLNSCSLGALSRRSMDAMTRFQEAWNEHGAQAWYSIWMGELTALREKFARLIGAQPHEIALATNVSAALSEIATGLDLAGRERVVLADMDFPTLAYQWLAKQRMGMDVVFVDSPDRSTLPVKLFEGVVNDRTGLVATSRVFFLSGYIQDVRKLAKIAHQHGALLLVDDYQGTGQIPLDVKALDIDFLVSGTLKWLMGGPGVAFAYVREELIPRMQPTVTGWFGSRDQFQFHTKAFEYRDDAQRLEAGTPAIAPVYAASAALDIVLEIGVERIRERTRWLADDLVRRVLEHGWKVRSPLDGSQRSSIVLLELDRPEELVHGLTERGIVVDSRPGLLRISPHFYNTVEENEAVVSALDELIRQR